VRRASLVIPAWNEPESIGEVLDEVPPELFDQVFVVVAGAADPTAAVAAARGAEVLVQHARGYGAACWSGAQEAIARGSEVVAFLDGDYSDPPAALARLLQPLREGTADLVLGCRDLRRFPHALPPHARLGNRLVCSLIAALLGVKFRDLPSCKAIRADALLGLEMREMTYGWTVELLVKAARQHLRIDQIDIDYRPRRGGRSKVAGDPRASLQAAYKLVACALKYATTWHAVSAASSRRPWSSASGT
jgi:glycosyltransferase involved in cell wall biosynthesis